VYPNPTLGLVTVNDAFGDIFRNIDLYNSLGVKVFSKPINSRTYQLDMSYMPSGVYMIVVTTKGGVKKQQIIKE
jgi:hypothetical protein